MTVKKNKRLTTSHKVTKKNNRNKIILMILIPIMILVLAGVTYGAKLYAEAKKTVDDSYYELDRDKTSTSKGNEIKVNPIEDTISVLVMGIDDDSARQLGSARTDALIYLTINPKEHKINMVSIPRDSYTTIVSKKYNGKDKINSAYTYGEEQATIETVEKLLNVPINYYVTFNFDSFLEIVDALDGIDVDVPVSFTDTNTLGNGEVHLEKGKQLLNGEEALALARTRHIDNDIKRGERQQLILQAIVDKAMNVGSINKYSDVIKAAGKNMRTNLKFNEMLSIAQTGLDGRYTFNSYVFDWTDFELEDASMVELYQDSVDFISHRFRVSLGLDEPNEQDAADYQFVTNGYSQYKSTNSWSNSNDNTENSGSNNNW
ncbi:LCP family protein [Carnobacterium maltaromaticum]|uniref:LCP family protein n=3 Tax=Carnobacterium TaxID=2747 RepID=A0AAW9K5X0_CARML|nr:LCP family protein [Carnobacterium maltaromaticum]MDZ5758777.1 LCP family protein [Carnobacterium maltaromaticum]